MLQCILTSTKLGKVAQLTNSVCLTNLGACTMVKMAGIFFHVFLKYQVSEISVTWLWRCKRYHCLQATFRIHMPLQHRPVAPGWRV